MREWIDEVFGPEAMDLLLKTCIFCTFLQLIFGWFIPFLFVDIRGLRGMDATCWIGLVTSAIGYLSGAVALAYAVSAKRSGDKLWERLETNIDFHVEEHFGGSKTSHWKERWKKSDDAKPAIQIFVGVLIAQFAINSVQFLIILNK